KDEERAAPLRRVDAAGMIGREQVLKAGNGNYQKLQAGPDAVYYGAAPADGDDGTFELRSLGLEADEPVTIAGGIGDYRVAADGKHAVVRFSGKLARLETKADQDPVKNAIDLSRMKILIDPPREWRQEFVDGWRILRDWRSEEHTSELQSRENLVCRL